MQPKAWATWPISAFTHRKSALQVLRGRSGSDRVRLARRRKNRRTHSRWAFELGRASHTSQYRRPRRTCSANKAKACRRSRFFGHTTPSSCNELYAATFLPLTYAACLPCPPAHPPPTLKDRDGARCRFTPRRDPARKNTNPLSPVPSSGRRNHPAPQHKNESGPANLLHNVTFVSFY